MQKSSTRSHRASVVFHIGYGKTSNPYGTNTIMEWIVMENPLWKKLSEFTPPFDFDFVQSTFLAS